MQQYLDLLKEVMEKGEDRPNRTGIPTRTLFARSMDFDLSEGFPAVTTKKLAFKTMKAELLCFLKGSQDVKEFQALGCNIWNENAEAPYWKPKAKFEGDLGRIYGVQWRRWHSPWHDAPIDQLHHVIERIKKDPYDRRLIVSAWNPADLDQMALPPCHMMFQFDVSADGKLSLWMVQRSCDMFLGVPFNIASYSLLLHLVAQATGLKPGRFNHWLGNTHIYQNHFDQVKEQLTRTPYPLPKLWLNPEIKNIDDFKMDDIKLLDYQHHPPIEAPMAV